MILPTTSDPRLLIPSVKNKIRISLDTVPSCMAVFKYVLYDIKKSKKDKDPNYIYASMKRIRAVPIEPPAVAPAATEPKVQK